MEDKLIMKDATKRSILRWIHIVFSIPILGYIYSPFEEIPKYADRVRFVVVPVMVLSGLDVERPCPSTTYCEEIGLKSAAANRCRHGRSFPKSAHRAGDSAFFTGIGLTSHSSRPAKAGGLTPTPGPVYRVA